MKLETARQLLDQGYHITHPEIGDKVCLLLGESGTLRDLFLDRVPDDYWESAPAEGWKIFRNTRTIYFQENPDKRDTDASKCVISEFKEGEIRIKWYDCLDSITNRISIDRKGLRKLERMQEALGHIKKLFDHKMAEVAKIRPDNFEQWSPELSGDPDFEESNWYYKCKMHQAYLDLIEL